MTATPAASAWDVSAKTRGCSSITKEPDVGRYAPLRIFNNVDLPAPFSPINACTDPARTSKETSVSALTPGNSIETRLNESICEDRGRRWKNRETVEELGESEDGGRRLRRIGRIGRFGT